MKIAAQARDGWVVKNRWCLPQDFREEFGAESSGTILLQAPIEEVQTVLAKALQARALARDRGEVLRTARSRRGLRARRLPRQRGEARRREAEGGAPASEEEKKPAKKPEAATTVAAPERGCPPPSFEQAEVRASRVLEVFLSPEQLEDFRTRQQFVVEGADTGHRYLLTVRHAPARSLAQAAGRSTTSTRSRRTACTTGRCPRPRSCSRCGASSRCPGASTTCATSRTTGRGDGGCRSLRVVVGWRKGGAGS